MRLLTHHQFVCDEAKRRSCLAALALFCSSIGFVAESQAHNGAIAVAFPATDIKVDGDFSDWPTDAKIYHARKAEYGDKPESMVDFGCTFRVAFDEAEKTLFVAVQVTDDSTVVDAPGSHCDWDTRDGCEIYIDAKHPRNRASIKQFSKYGNLLSTFGGARRTDATIAVSDQENTRNYEW